MRTILAVGGVLALAAGGVLAVGLIAGATAAADDTCPPAAAPTASAQALRAGNPAAAHRCRRSAPGAVCQPATDPAGAGGGGGAAGGADASFDPGNIASDEVFYNTDLDDPGADHRVHRRAERRLRRAWCLRNLALDTASQPADAYCQAYTGGPAQSAAKMLFDFSRACGINPQVMLTTLQKESQGLTRTDATESSYAAAWGWHCPDTGPGGTANCDPQHAGFFNQGYGMAHQWARYRVEIPNGKYNYQPGRTYDIAWNVAESGCGGAPVTIRNLATASLYVYTPYQPNAGVAGRLPRGGRRVLRVREPELLPDVPDLLRVHRRRHRHRRSRRRRGRWERRHHRGGPGGDIRCDRDDPGQPVHGVARHGLRRHRHHRTHPGDRRRDRRRVRRTWGCSTRGAAATPTAPPWASTTAARPATPTATTTGSGSTAPG